MPKKDTTQSFIEKSLEKFGNILNYNKVHYKNSRSKVCLVCNIHGEFYQTPMIHLSSSNPCPKCSHKVPTQEDLIKKFNDKHGNKYDYSLVKYKSFSDKIKIICPLHGEFEQHVGAHLSGRGCGYCAENIQHTKDIFVTKAQLVHGTEYDYTLVEYINNSTKVKIICKEHGVFEQTPANHYKYGCLICSGKYLKTNFIEQASIAHNNRYDYSLVSYKGMFKKVKIICPVHGVFEQIPSNHLHHKKGCSKCVGVISRGETEWLDLIGITTRQHVIKINGKRFKVDGYDPNTKTVYEYNGDFWHGNPKLYPSEKRNFFGVKFGELYQRTLNKENTLIASGYNVKSIWESDFIAGFR
jgi:hypothetical protein